MYGLFCFFFFKQKTAYEIGTGDWSSDVCSSDLVYVKSVYNSLCEIDGITFHKSACLSFNVIILLRKIGRASCRERV